MSKFHCESCKKLQYNKEQKMKWISFKDKAPGYAETVVIKDHDATLMICRWIGMEEASQFISLYCLQPNYQTRLKTQYDTMIWARIEGWCEPKVIIREEEIRNEVDNSKFLKDSGTKGLFTYILDEIKALKEKMK